MALSRTELLHYRRVALVRSSKLRYLRTAGISDHMTLENASTVSEQSLTVPTIVNALSDPTTYEIGIKKEKVPPLWVLILFLSVKLLLYGRLRMLAFPLNNRIPYCVRFSPTRYIVTR